MVETLSINKRTEFAQAEVVPTLFIGLGGTGAEVLWRIRRRILTAQWSVASQAARLENLDELPFAEFLHIDLDTHSFTGSGKYAKTDVLIDKVRFSEHENVVERFDLGKYFRTEEELAKYPMLKEWFPLSNSKLREIGFDFNSAPGQIRAISRLYFFDKYAEIKYAIRAKTDRLRAAANNAEAIKRLDITIQKGALKIVVVASTAGAAGSGMFLDVGYLSSIIGKQAEFWVTTNLVLMLPTGYKGANHTRSQANTYAALMELETCMRPGASYIKGWSENEVIRDWPKAPYSDVYLIDTSNVAAAHTEDIKDVYDMVADSLFDDLSMPELSRRKHHLAVHQMQHKIWPYYSKIPRETYGDMKLTFSRGYSSFGQATLNFEPDSRVGIDEDQQNYVLAALEVIPDRAQLLSDFLQRAMPWIDAKLEQYLMGRNDQYRCLIGVKDSNTFEARYGQELRNLVPAATLMTGRSIAFVEIDTPGKLVCYVELSGLPLPSLMALDDWYTAYREETPKIPVLTHQFAGTFVHPRELTTDELASRAEDFKLFIEAMALGVLTRGEKGADVGVLKLRHKGSTSNIGDERMLRMDGFPVARRPIIKQQVELDLEEIKTDDQLGLWVALMEYYLESVYPLSIRSVNKVDVELKSLPTLICEKLVKAYTERLERKMGGEAQAERLLRSARDTLIKWTDELAGSTADVYQYEVNAKALKPKRVLKREVMQAGWTLAGVQQAAPAVAPQAAARAAITAKTEVRFRAFINKKQEGPWSVAEMAQKVSDGAVGADTKVWNMAWDLKTDKWQTAGNVAELQGLFVPDPYPDK